MALRQGTGGLISFNGVSFPRGRSKALSNNGLSAPTTHAVAAGAPLRIDMLGSSPSPADFNLSYEYLIAPITSLHDVQTQWDALILVIGTVGELVTFATGDYTDTISGMARLESAVRTNDDVNFWVVSLQFFCEAGMA